MTVDPQTDQFKISGFSASRPLANGDRVLLSSATNAMPKEQLGTNRDIELDAHQFYIVSDLSSDLFRLSLPGFQFPLNIATAGSGLSLRRISQTPRALRASRPRGTTSPAAARLGRESSPARFHR